MIFNKVANHSRSDSLSTRLREKRFSLFLSMLSKLEYPIMILDVGGTIEYWEAMKIEKVEGISITILNTEKCEMKNQMFTYIQGDARDLKFPNKYFDVVFSNSVIEHVGGIDEQFRMAQEITRVGKRYFIQTPDKSFFIEPHFLFPYFQFLPKEWRIWLLMNLKLGWFKRQTSLAQAQNIAESISLLKKQELLSLFPGCHIFEEKIFGITKSFIAYSGWD